MFNMDPTTLVWGLIFGSVGFAYFMYGKKQNRPVPLLSGIGLMGYPYIIGHSTFLLVGIGVLLTAVPWFLQV